MASYNSIILFLACLMAPRSHLFLFNGGVTGGATYYTSPPWYRQWSTTVPAVPTTAAPATSTCPPPAVCPSCPANYVIVQEHTYGCNYRCSCELLSSSGPASSPVAAKPSLSKNILLSILHNIQNNAAALEQMALGLNEEASIAQNVADITSI